MTWITILISFFKAVMVFPMVISGGSMLPVFHEGDVVQVSGWEARVGDIERGDVVVFTMEGAELSGSTVRNEMYFVKRVIGLPGEEIVIRDGVVFVDGIVLDEPYVRGETWVSSFEDVVLSADGGGFVYTVPEGEYFVLGDNREASIDSRNFVRSFVPREWVVGVVEAGT